MQMLLSLVFFLYSAFHPFKIYSPSTFFKTFGRPPRTTPKSAPPEDPTPCLTHHDTTQHSLTSCAALGSRFRLTSLNTSPSPGHSTLIFPFTRPRPLARPFFCRGRSKLWGPEPAALDARSGATGRSAKPMRSSALFFFNFVGWFGWGWRMGGRRVG